MLGLVAIPVVFAVPDMATAALKAEWLRARHYDEAYRLYAILCTDERP